MPRTSVLVVDDDVDTREMVSLVLDLAGFEVLTASGGAEGLAQARLHHPLASEHAFLLVVPIGE